jgi:Xaa-Pro aminopeptidase
VETILIAADTVRSADMRHVLPVLIPDPCVYIEHGGERHLFIGSLELPRVQKLGLVVHANEELGSDEISERSETFHEYDREIALRACRLLGVTAVVTPPTCPLGLADHLRANGVDVRPDDGLFVSRRRAKSPEEVAGIRRAQRAAERAMTATRERLREGGDLSSEDLQAVVSRSFQDSGMIIPPDVILSHGPQTAVGHEQGSGRIAAGEPIVADLIPQDPESGCFADMTRTFCVGEAPAELVTYQRLCRQSLERVMEAIRPGVTGAELHRLSCGPFATAGYPTQLSKEPGTVLTEGFFHSLGHGVGLDVHEPPFLGRGGPALVPGDVIAVEPGCYRPGFGGCRLEDLVLVTDDGCELITDYPYQLTP